MLLDQLGDELGAERALRHAVDVLRPLAVSDTAKPKSKHNLALALNNLSFVLKNSDEAAAETASREAVDLLQRLASQSSPPGDFQDDLALFYNNLAALQSRKGDWNEAISAHQHAIELQEQTVRKSPAVIRYRSELAISLNNLGVAYCRAAKPAEADAAFVRARELFATLAKDYPDELAYRTLLAAQLNNQALALAGAGRHADALPIYAAAIDAQKICRDQAPNSARLREDLSKMYFNYGQSLRNEHQWQDAMDAAIARGQLWKGDSQREIGVAAELANLDNAVKEHAADEAKKEANLDVEGAVLTALERAYDSGWPQNVDPAKDKRFDAFRKNKRFAAKVAELNERFTKGQASQNKSN
jgi:tetratricopeptide (TPR) repeat protein